ncbi:hypothetical protein GGE45_005881 [Rhizobium aethiopicum]|uniref:hypothetical protein n=1 Tax=Rhizobium aethiopicum TaxID=1138170 RepID=UPI00182D2071|nr:hypothetical protein [Rhizobium aethiopicum]MBB4583507.1 hypothetical protein [Rhizobium aethiopicum]
MDNRAEQLAFTEEKFKAISTGRRAMIEKLEIITDRYTEIATLLDRFNLLRDHYVSDYERLLGIREAGNFFRFSNSRFARHAVLCPTITIPVWFATAMSR